MKEQMSRMEELNRYYEVWRETNYIYEDWAKQHGTSACCLLTLISIDESEDPCTQKRISQQWSMPKQTTNMVLKDLESKGYVELVPLPEDKRNKQIRFTEAGKQYADSILSELRNAEFAVIEKMGLERIRRLNEDSELFIRLFRELGTDRSDEHKQTGCTDYSFGMSFPSIFPLLYRALFHRRWLFYWKSVGDAGFLL